MYRKACPAMLLALAVGLVLVRRRLNDIHAEVRLLELAVRARGASAAEQPAARAEPIPSTAGGTLTADIGAALRVSEDFSVWEQAVPPMDS
jgi:hypothetical protein